MTSNDQILLERSLEKSRREFDPNAKVDDFFEYFCAECVLYDMHIGSDKIQQGNVDGNGDGGIDSFYVFLNDELVLDGDMIINSRQNRIDIYAIQSKHTRGFKQTPVIYLSEAIEMILNNSIEEGILKNSFRPKLVRKILQFRELWSSVNLRPYSINVHARYCTIGEEVSPQVQQKATELEAKISRIGSTIKCNFEFIGAKRLIQLSQRMSQIECAELLLVDTPINPSQGGYVALTSIENYYNFITKDGKLRQSLFDMNVRDYQGSTSVNAQIQMTLENPQDEDFWWLNNGVSIISSGVRNSNKKLSLDYPQIVNGLQTSFEIFRRISNGNYISNQKNILIRIVEIPLENKASRDKIIRATNSQTQLPPSSFRSTDEIHRSIENYFKDNNLFYDRRRSYYSNQGIPKEQIVSIEHLAQCMTAIALGQPYTAQTQENIYNENNTSYQKIFSNHTLTSYRNAVMLVKICERYSVERNFKYGVDSVKYYVAYVVAAIVSGRVAINDTDLSTMEVANIGRDILEKSYNKVNQMYNIKANLQKQDVSQNLPDFTSDCKNYIREELEKVVVMKK